MKNWQERKQVILELMKNELYVPMKEKELAIMLQVEGGERGAFKQALNELLAEKLIGISKRGKYTLYDPKKAAEERNHLLGTFIGNQRGFGFVEVEGRDEDLFIPENRVNGAYHLDLVEVSLLPRRPGRRQEAEIIQILERGTNTVVGIYRGKKNFGFVIPDNQKLSEDIFIPIEGAKGAIDGHKVVVELTFYGDEKRSPEGKVIEILGHMNDPGVDILSVVKGFELPLEFPEKVMRQAERVKDQVIEADLEGRKDYRQLTMVTIDGEDAKDLDDAVSLTAEDGLFHLGVHIADVSNYVQEASALDKEALRRGTSVYLVDRVIPMLPHKLSNGICSLNEGVDRLALSCMMTINEQGEVIDYRIEESVICVNQRMTYTAVKKILEDQDQEERKHYAELVGMFEQMERLAALLRAKRKKRGSIDFDFPESKIYLDQHGKVEEIKPYDRNTATKIIEEFMLIANETVAQHFFWLDIPFVYRTHDIPDPEKIQKLATFISNFGFYLKLRQEEIHPKEIQKLLAKVEGSGQENLISRLALRSMKQAKYTVDCTGHFGLACTYYCHFTSPIRRYPDLQIHRMIKDWLRGRLKPGKLEHYAGILPQICSQSSRLERRAEEAERETNKLKKVEYMEQHMGEVFTGVISGVTQWGIYVELPNTIEGMVHVSKLPGDYFYYDEQAYEMVGSRTDIRYRLGQQVRVVAKKTDRMLRTIDFEIADGDIDEVG